MHTHEHQPFLRQAEFLCTADHVIPRAKGGTNRRENIVAACRGCNEVRSNAEKLDRLEERIEKLKWLASREI